MEIIFLTVLLQLMFMQMKGKNSLYPIITFLFFFVTSFVILCFHTSTSCQSINNKKKIQKEIKVKFFTVCT